MATKTTFFSYSRTDTDFVFKLVNDLREAGADIWIDQVDLKKGYWDSAIETALNSCSQLIIVLSPNSVSSPNVMDEVSYAIENKKTVIPVLLEDCNVPFRLSRFQRIDFTTDYAHGMKHLLVAMDIGGDSSSEEIVESKIAGILKKSRKKGFNKKYIFAAVSVVLLSLLLWAVLPFNKKDSTSNKVKTDQPKTSLAGTTFDATEDSLKKEKELKAMLDSIALGANFRGGKIFYIDNSGRHGLIAAPYDQSKLITWNNGNVAKKGAYGTALGDGNDNTKSLIETPGDVIQAAKICSDLKLKGYKDWFLPSKDELNELYKRRNEVGGFANVYYWSSSEDFNADVWYQSFFSGKQFNKTERNTACVRAIRAF